MVIGCDSTATGTGGRGDVRVGERVRNACDVGGARVVEGVESDEPVAGGGGAGAPATAEINGNMRCCGSMVAKMAIADS